jgi:chromosome segregation ATPase
MTDDLEARIKALEEKLTPQPDKMSSMKATNRLKQYLDDRKGEKESQEDVVWRIIEQAEKVPSLEKEIGELRAKVWELEHEKDSLSEFFLKKIENYEILRDEKDKQIGELEKKIEELEGV